MGNLKNGNVADKDEVTKDMVKGEGDMVTVWLEKYMLEY